MPRQGYPNLADPFSDTSSRTPTSTMVHRLSARQFPTTQTPTIFIVLTKTEKCAENAYLKAERQFEAEKATREQSTSKWEQHALVSICVAYGIHFIATVTIYARFVRAIPVASAFGHNTPASIICSFIALAFGICILALSLGYFLWLEDSLFYLYIFLSVGLYAIYSAFSNLLFAPLRVDTEKSTEQSASRFQRWLAHAARLREMYLKQFGVAGYWFLHAAIIKELVELSIQTRGLFRYARSQDAFVTAALCTTLALNCLLSPYGYVRQRKGSVIACDGMCDLVYTIISATQIVARGDPILFLDALPLLFPILSMVDILNSFAAYSVKAKSSGASKGLLRATSGIVRLPSHDYSQSNIAQKMYTFLLSLFMLCACVICGISGYTLFRCVSQHLECSERYSSCLWRKAWPREYMQGGIFSRNVVRRRSR